MEHLWTAPVARWREAPCFGRKVGGWQDVKRSAMLLHDKHQPGASSDKALIQKIPPSFAEILMRIWSARQGGDTGAVVTPCHCLLSQSLSPYLLIGQAWLAMKETWQHGGPSYTGPTPARLHGKPDSTVCRKQTGWHQAGGGETKPTEVVY